MFQFCTLLDRKWVNIQCAIYHSKNFELTGINSSSRPSGSNPNSLGPSLRSDNSMKETAPATSRLGSSCIGPYILRSTSLGTWGSPDAMFSGSEQRYRELEKPPLIETDCTQLL